MSTRFTDEELNDSMDKYADSYNDNDFWSIVKTYGKTIGSGVIVKVLELYYLLQKAVSRDMMILLHLRKWV